jgi:hypothetical protein
MLLIPVLNRSLHETLTSIFYLHYIRGNAPDWQI